MFCPVCRCEFRPSFTRCASCDADLVDDLAATPTRSASEVVREAPVIRVQLADICGYLDLDEARRARDLLHARHIAAELAIRSSPETTADGPVVEEYWLRADAQQVRQVSAVLDEHAEREPVVEGESFECSHCGKPVRAQESFCANCGMRFS
jgi:hypothetical protein